MTGYLDLKVTSKQRSNLEKLLKGLKAIPDETARETFNMEEFAIDGEDLGELDLNEAAKPSCGSVMCMIGHGPLVGIKPIQRDRNDWHNYSARVFGAAIGSKVEELLPKGHDDSVWDWLFSPQWTYVDNTMRGGIKRLEIALEHGIPDNYHEQLRGKTPLSYEATP